MDRNDQRQTVEGASTAIQSARDINLTINQGLSYSDVRDIATNVFVENFMTLKGEAMALARERNEQITEKYLHRLEKEYPTGLQQAQSPAFLDSLFNVQREFAKSGDENLGDLLVSLLVDRTKQEQRGILQLVLTEALNTAPKITSEQIDMLSVIFFLKRVQAFPESLEHLVFILNLFLSPFVGKLKVTRSDISYLEFTGCGTGAVVESPLAASLDHFYGGFFRRGFASTRLDAITLPSGLATMPSPHDPAMVVFAVPGREHLGNILLAAGSSQEETNATYTLFNEGKMSHDEIKNLVISRAPFMKEFFEVWDSSGMKSFNLTSVGIALAHANFKRLIGAEASDLAIWVN